LAAGCSSTCTIEQYWECTSVNLTEYYASESNCTYVGNPDAGKHGKDNTTTILATIFPILAVLIGAFIFGVVAYYRKNIMLKKLKKPNFQEIAFGKDFTEEAPRLLPEQKEAIAELEEVVLKVNTINDLAYLGSAHESVRSYLRCNICY
jgi:hypothetical protein